MNHYTRLFSLVLMSISSAWAQDTLRISKNELQQKVIEQNWQLKITNQAVASARADYRQTNAVFLPSVSASYTGISTTNPLMAFGSKLNQEILTAADFNPALLNDPKKTKNFATKFEVLQPLINADGWIARGAAKTKMQAYQLQSERTAEYLKLEVNKAYMQLQLAYKALAVIKKAQATAQANLKLIENYFKQGMVQKTDVLLVQVRVGEIQNQAQYALSNVQNASDYLHFLLGETQDKKVYQPTENLVYEPQMNTVSGTISEQRKDIQAMMKTSEAYQKMSVSDQMGYLPRLNAFGSYELYDTAFLGTAAKGYTVGAQLSWNVFDGYKTIGKAQKSKAEYQKANTELEQYKAQSQLELNKTLRQLTDAQNKVNLSRLALEQSQEAYRIRQNRFAQGLEKTTDLLASETQQLQKELELDQAVFEYQLTQTYLQFLTN
ncbi:TolC family protein [Flavobacterium sp. CYK-55]|uniref:TolC family protein n=1 Tax=Flavobacterium sp. CYK-55 TaxID=2835529 RepID=UPI001BCE7151|nr:TolC family protein [Flavobacterium sp. CYK-55]MBS7788011.1 TolC family protein [Flavobacterium sp. CYK-55]